MKHRHAMVVHAYYPVGETRVQREAAALVEEGMEVEVICLRRRGEPACEVIDGVTVRRVPLARHRRLGVAVQFLEYLTFAAFAALVLSVRHVRRRFDSVQVHNLPDFLVFSALVPKLTGSRIILDLHDLMPEFLAARLDRTMDHPLVRLVAFQERVSCSFADGVITVTDGWRDRLIGRGVDPDKVLTVMNVADPELFPLRTQKVEEVAPFTILYHGTFTARYGVEDLVEACARIAGRIPAWRLCLLGDGDARGAIEASIGRLGLSASVELSPRMLTIAELQPYLRHADVGVVPNRSSVFTDDLLPTKLMEYVATGIPVVASCTPMIRSYFDDDMVEFFEPGNAGDLAESLVALASSPERRYSLAVAARRFTEDHHWDRIRKGYAQFVVGRDD